MFFAKKLHHKIKFTMCIYKIKIGLKIAKYIKKVLNMLKINKIIIINQIKIIFKKKIPHVFCEKFTSQNKIYYVYM